MREVRFHTISFAIIIAFGLLCIFLTDCARETAANSSDTLSSDCDSIEEHVEKECITPSTIVTVEDARTYIDTTIRKESYRFGIIPQMLDDAPDYAIKLLQNTHDRFIVVDKYRMKVIVFNKFGIEEASFGMACAKNFGTKHKKADSRTPEGFFTVQGVYDSTDWLFTDDEGNTSDKKGQFGPRFIRLNIPTTSQIGIHGTCAPWSIGGRSSHGCIRIHNDNIMKLVELVDSGMPVIITPGLKDMQVNKDEGYTIKAISTVVGRKAPVIRNTVKEDDPEDNDTIPQILPIENAEQPADTVQPL